MSFMLVLFGGLFLAMTASLYLEYEAREKQRAKEAATVELVGTAVPGRCMLCGAPLRRERTTAEVVFEVEHRIDVELQDISHLLRTAPEKVSRLYLA
jgi:hypothetical protein